MPKILQALMYMLGFTREEICQPNSQLFFWKKAKELIKEQVPEKMKNHTVLGPKEGDYKLYQKINYCEKIISGLEQETIDQHNATFGKLFKWLWLALQTRKTDIIYRKAHTKKQRELREKALEASAERKENRAATIKDAEEQFMADHEADFTAYDTYVADQKRKENEEYDDESEEEGAEEKEIPTKPEFNAKEVEDKFDEENPDVEIPAEVAIQKDNDWALHEEDE